MSDPKSAEKDQKSGLIELVAHAPIFYLLVFFLGAIGHVFSPVYISSDPSVLVALGGVSIILGPLLILWSQKSIRRFKKDLSENQKKNFDLGPYRFTRNPTYLGLTFLMAGFGFFANSTFIVFSAIVAFIVVNFVVVRREEKMMEEKYGVDYLNYKKSVHRWF